MKKIIALFAVGFSLICSSSAQFIFLENPPDMSNGSYLGQQQLSFNGSSISWATGTPGSGQGFFVQAFEDFGNIFLSFGEWNGAPYEVTTNALASDTSVSSQTLWQGQKQIIQASPITNQYYGIRYDAGGGSFNYGWINLSTISSYEAGRINSVAFNSVVNADILAGQTVIPEPNAVAFFTFLTAVIGISIRRTRAGLV